MWQLGDQVIVLFVLVVVVVGEVVVVEDVVDNVVLFVGIHD